MVYQYQWTDGARFTRIEAQAVGEYFEKLRETQGGILTPDVVVASAKSKTSLLHDVFEWDDKEAAKIHRQDVARAILRGIKCVIKVQTPTGEQSRTTRAFVAVDNGGQTDYAHIDVVLGSDDYKQQLMTQACLELESFKRKYAELTDLVKLIDEALTTLKSETVAA